MKTNPTLGFVAPVGESTAAPPQFSATVPLTDAEHRALLDAMAFTLESTQGQPIGPLREAADSLVTLIEDWPNQPREVYIERSSTVQRAAKTWLTQLREFEDKMPHRLSKRFGKASLQLQAFTDAKAEEWAQNFCFRFACKLRNYAQHAGDPIQHMAATSEKRGEYVVRVQFNPEVLLSSYDGWTTVKKDLEALRGRSLDVVPVVQQAMASCEIILAHTLLAQEKELLDATAVLDAASKRIDAPPVSAPAIFYMPDDSAFTQPHPSFTVSVKPLPDRSPEIVRTALDECRQVLQHYGKER